MKILGNSQKYYLTTNKSRINGRVKVEMKNAKARPLRANFLNIGRVDQLINFLPQILWLGL